MTTYVRRGRINDIPRVLSIYNYYVENSYATFDLQPWTIQEKEPWFIDTFAHLTEEMKHLFHHHHPDQADAAPRNVLLVCAEEKKPIVSGSSEPPCQLPPGEEDDEVLGYAYFTDYRSARRAYARTKEASVYIDQQQLKRGLGSMLYKQLIVDAREEGTLPLLPFTSNPVLLPLQETRASLPLLHSSSSSLPPVFTRCAFIHHSTLCLYVCGSNALVARSCRRCTIAHNHHTPKIHHTPKSASVLTGAPIALHTALVRRSLVLTIHDRRSCTYGVYRRDISRLLATALQIRLREGGALQRDWLEV